MWQMLRKAVPLMRFGMAQLFAVQTARHKQRRIYQQTAQTFERFDQLISAAQRVYTELVTGMFALTSAISRRCCCATLWRARRGIACARSIAQRFIPISRLCGSLRRTMLLCARRFSAAPCPAARLSAPNGNAT